MRLLCVPCGIEYCGIAKVGTPCAYCLTPIVDETALIAEAAERYDVARWIVQR